VQRLQDLERINAELEQEVKPNANWPSSAHTSCRRAMR
jgi:hypothetical protein